MKNKQVGEFGENYFLRFLKDNKIDYLDHRNSREDVQKTFFVPQTKKRYIYNYYQFSHPFDFSVNNKNIEIKTSRIDKKGCFCASWVKNRRKDIDYIILFVINDNFEVKYIYTFNNEYINKHPAVKIKLITNSNIEKKYTPISEKELLQLLTS